MDASSCAARLVGSAKRVHRPDEGRCRQLAAVHPLRGSKSERSVVTRRSTLALAIAGLALIVVAIVAWHAPPRAPLLAPAASEGCAPAQDAEAAAPRLTLEQMSGGWLCLQDLEGEVVLVNTWAT